MAASGTTPSARDRREDQLTLFAGAWGLFLLIHQAATYQSWLTTLEAPRLLLGAAAALTALLLVVGPSRLARLVIATLAFLAYQMSMTPLLQNHIMLAVMMAVTILLSIAAEPARADGDEPESRRRIHRRLSGLLILELLTMYFFVVLHKLNVDYFDAHVSCAVGLSRDIIRYWGAGDDWSWAHQPSIYGALAAEALIPAMLVWRRTRRAGIAMALSFHLLLSLHPELYVYSYSALVYAMLTLFLPEGFLAAASRLRPVAALGRLWSTRGLAIAIGAAVVAAATLVIPLALVMTELVDTDELMRTIHALAPPLWRWTWYLVALLAIATFVAVLTRRPHDPPLVDQPFAKLVAGARGWLLILPLLVLLNGLCPYVGLKTKTSFAMFSNLRTENRVTNHLFMPVTLRVAGYQDDLVRITATDDPNLELLVAKELSIPAFELRSYIGGQSSGHTLTLERSGETHTLDLNDRATAERNPALADLLIKPGWLERRLWSFRAVDPEDSPMQCRH